MKAHRPTIMGTRHMVAACHYLAAEAGFRMLEAGGNAIDAGVAIDRLVFHALTALRAQPR